MREDAIFRIFSMTKPLTCLAVLMLYEEGAFHLQYPVAMYLPQFNELKVLVKQGPEGMELAPLERPVTIYDLLTHTSGLGYGLDAGTPVNAMFQQAAMLRPDESMADKIERLVKIPLPVNARRVDELLVLGHMLRRLQLLMEESSHWPQIDVDDAVRLGKQPRRLGKDLL